MAGGSPREDRLMQPHHCRRFEGKRVLITGASLGIGRATAERFASASTRLMQSNARPTGLTRMAEPLPKLP